MADATLIEALQRHQLGALADTLGALASDAIALEFAPVDLASIAPGGSRAGGLPDVPGTFAWPVVREWALPFLMQLDLRAVAAVLPEGPLPRQGWLLFFGAADEAAKGAPEWLRSEDGYDSSEVFQVRYIDAPLEDLLRATAPQAGEALPCHAVSMTLTRSLPSASSPHVLERLRALAAVPATPAEATEAPGAAAAPSAEIAPAPTPAQRYNALRDEVASVRDHLLGHPTSIQDDVLVEAIAHLAGRTFPLAPEAIEAVYQDAMTWRLLVQLDSSAPRGWDFVSGGRLYLVLSSEDLTQHRFDRARAVLQR